MNVNEPQFSDSIPIFESIVTPVFFSDLKHISKSILIFMPINLELESLILHNHISLMAIDGKWMCTRLSTFLFRPNSWTNFDSRTLLDLNQIPKSVVVPEPLTLEPKLIISPNHIQLLDKGVQQYDSVIFFHDWAIY